MRIFDARFLAVTVMVSSLLFLYSPVPVFAVSFPNDTNTHMGKDGNCVEHMDNPTAIPADQSFTLCAALSGATEWAVAINKYNFPYTTVCSVARTTVPAGGKATITPCIGALAAGSYKGIISFWVGSSSMMPGLADYKFNK